MLSSAMMRELPWITWPGVQQQHRWTHAHPTHQGAGPHLRMGAIPTRCFLPGFLPAGLHSGERDKGLLAGLAGCWSSEGLGLVAGCEACCVDLAPCQGGRRCQLNAATPGFIVSPGCSTYGFEFGDSLSCAPHLMKPLHQPEPSLTCRS
jgi:hypothetical protein